MTARAAEFERQARGLIEHRHRPIAVLGLARIARGDAERPDRASVRVLGPAILAPGAVEVHEIAEAATVRVPRILQERGVDRHPLVARHVVDRIHLRRQHQRARIVVDAIAVTAVGDREDRMLQHPGGIAHPLDRREIGGQRRKRRGRRDAARLGGDHLDDLRHRHFGKARPDHGAAARIGTLRQARAVAGVAEQPVDLLGEGRAVAEIDQHAVPVGQNFGRMYVRRRDHRLAHADRVAERTARDLRRVEIRRRIDVRRLQIVDQRVMFEECVDEHDVVRDPALRGERLQPVAILLAFIRDEVGMGRAKHRIEQVRMLRRDRGERIDHHFDALAGREQAERQHDVASGPAEARLQHGGVDEVAVRNAVRDHHDRAPACAIDALEDLAAALGHYDDLGGAAQQALHHAALVEARLLQHGVQRDDHRQRDAIEQRQDMLARRTAEDAVFVLQPDRLRAARLDRARGVEIRHTVLLGDAERHFGRILVAAGMVVHRIDVDRKVRKPALERGERIRRICCKAAFAGQEIADQRQVVDRHNSIYP